ENVRYRSMAAKPEHLSRDLLLQQHGGISSAPSKHQIPRGRDGQSRIRPYAERIRARGRPHADCDPGKFSGKGRQHHDSKRASSLYGRERTNYEVGKSLVRRDGRVVDGGGLENHCTRKGAGGSNPSPSARLNL